MKGKSKWTPLIEGTNQNYHTNTEGWKNNSAFYDAKRKWIDSIEYRYDDFFRAQYNGKEYYDFVGKTSSIKLFKNYPEGKIRVHDFFDICRWNIDEDMEKPEWNVTDSTANILGYECIIPRPNSGAGCGMSGSLRKSRFRMVRGNCGDSPDLFFMHQIPIMTTLSLHWK